MQNELPDNDLPEKVRELTEKFFREDKNNCAESVFRALMQATGHACPVELLKIASPFGRGMGEAGCVCGALVGGQMAIGIFLGRNKASGFAPDICAEAAKLLHKRFTKQNGAACCRILHKGKPFGTDEQYDSCCKRAVNAAELAANVILEVKENSGTKKI